VWDTTAGYWKRQVPEQFPYGAGLTVLSTATIAAGDLFYVWDLTAGAWRAFTFYALHEQLGSFYVYRTADVSSGGGGARKVPLNGELFDIRGWFDSTTNNRFQPLYAGKYLITAAARVNCSANEQFYAMLYKNGSLHSKGNTVTIPATGEITSVVSAVIDFNGSTDYVELYGQLTTTRNFQGGSSETYMSGVRVGA